MTQSCLHAAEFCLVISAVPYPQHHPLVSAAPLSQRCLHSLPGPKRTAPGDGRALLTAFRNKLASFKLAGKKVAEPRCTELEIGSQSLFFCRKLPLFFCERHHFSVLVYMETRKKKKNMKLKKKIQELFKIYGREKTPCTWRQLKSHTR